MGNLLITDLEKSAMNGELSSQLKIAYDYYKIDDEISNEKGFFWCKKAAEQGSEEAIFKLGYYYLYGVGCQKDFKKALKCFEEAEVLGNDNAIKMIKHMKELNLIENIVIFTIKMIIVVLLFATIIGGFLAYLILWPRRESALIVDYNSHRGRVWGEGYSTSDVRYLNAKPNEGYKFIGWYINNELVSKELKYKHTMGRKKDLSAVFIFDDLKEGENDGIL